MKRLTLKGIPASLVVFDYKAFGGPMRAYCAEMPARKWLEAHGFWAGHSVHIEEIVEWERSPTDRAADVSFRIGTHAAKFTDLIRTDLPVGTGGTAEAGDLMQLELDGAWAFFDHSCASWTGFSVTSSAMDGRRGFTLDPEFARVWLDRGRCRLRLHTQRLAATAAA